MRPRRFVLGAFSLSLCALSAAQQPRLVVPIGHTAPIQSLAFSPDGLTLLSSAQDGTARLWDVTTIREVAGFHVSSAFLNTAVFSADGKHVLIATPDDVSDWDTRTATMLRRISTNNSNYTGALSADPSPDGKLAVTVTSNGATVWNMATGTAQLDLGEQTRDIDFAKFSPDGKRILTATHRKPFQIWDTANGKLLATIPVGPDGVEGAEFTPDGNRIFATSFNGYARLWDVASGKQLRELKIAETISVRSSLSGKGDIFVAYRGSRLTIYRTEDFSELRSREFRGSEISAVAVSRDGSEVAIAFGDRRISVLDTRTLAVISTSVNAGTSVGAAAQVAGSDKLLVELGDKRHVEWAGDGLVDDFSPEDVLKAYPWLRSRNGAAQIDIEKNSTVTLKDAVLGQTLVTYPTNGAFVWDAHLSPDDQLVAVGEARGIVTVYDSRSGQLLASLQCGGIDVTSLAFSPDSSRLTTCSLGEKTRIWDLKSGTLLRELDAQGLVAFSSDGTRLVSSGLGGPARVWNVATGAQLASIPSPGSGFEEAVFSPDGRHVVTASADGTTRVWDAATGREFGALIILGKEWAVVTPDGWFDASPGALRMMYWVLPHTFETIDLDQVKTRYWLPGLAQKVIRGERLPPAPPFPVDRLAPSVRVNPPQGTSTVATVHLTRRGGGIGKVMVYVNDTPVPVNLKQAGFDSRSPATTLNVDLRGYFAFSLPNHIRVVAANESGNLTSRSLPVEFTRLPTSAESPPKLFVLCIGTGSYSGALHKLNLPPKDAADMAYALSLAGIRLFDGRVDVTLLTDDSGFRRPDLNAKFGKPSKSEITAAFERISKEAKPQDAVVVEFAGHGVSFRRGDLPVYCYLTGAATTDDMSDPDVRAVQAVSMDDLIKWMVPKGDGTGIKAERRVLVLDTCASGAAVADLGPARSPDPDVKKALELFKDATGFWVLAGSAADALSYEAGQFGQGMLTYALLEGMQGPGLLADTVDIRTLFGFAQLEVPRLVKSSIGGIQAPQVFSMNESFPIGMLSESDRSTIRPAEPRPRILRPQTLSNVDPANPGDSLGLTPKVKAQLAQHNEVSARGRTGVWFVDADELAGALVPGGNYKIEGARVTVSLVLRVGNVAKTPVSTVVGEVGELDELAKNVVAEILRLAATIPVPETPVSGATKPPGG